MSVPDRIRRLVETFDRSLESYKRGIYNETQVRREFVDPFFEELGWDVTDCIGVGPQQHIELTAETVKKDLILRLKTHFLTPKRGL